MVLAQVVKQDFVQINMKQEEHKIQVAIVNYCKYNRIPIFAIPNGGHRYYSVAIKLKKEGVVSGVADLFIYQPNNQFNGLFIEVKYGKNKQSENQKIFEKNVLQFGYQYKLVYSLEEFILIYNEYRTKSLPVKD